MHSNADLEKKSLKLHLNHNNSSLNIITTYGEGYVYVNNERFEHSIALTPASPKVHIWNISNFLELNDSDFSFLIDWEPEIILLGSYRQQHILDVRIRRILMKRQIGIELMNFGAACRTYNLLINEGRKIALALIIQTNN